jgi:basic membrane protein A
VAGRTTHSNKIGYVAAHPVPPLLLALNAFTLGARSVNPKVKVHVTWTNSWCDPATEAEAATGLIDQGADVLAAHMDSTITVVETAEKHKLCSVGYHADVQHLAPKGWLTGQRWDWGPIYVTMTKSVLDHTWKPGNISHGPNDAYGKLSSFGPKVSETLRQQALAQFEDLRTGKLVLFKGPMKDRDGKERIPAGKILTNQELGKMNWLVPGIEGAL